MPDVIGLTGFDSRPINLRGSAVVCEKKPDLVTDIGTTLLKHLPSNNPIQSMPPIVRAA
eukprot:CAMPEP_0180825254 /NCGR_PEP_ID=MMETSP1038_2-20121128/72868_1 /TAXON_ID=632150 /ORGANISM="Azadinium spinosum, Strain 3D9" /LENGTH=58 /DNA_ID=CAMNT_0022867695 /DNA_START=93 /DNA_END=269 /DNA_ORIENTATION=+